MNFSQYHYEWDSSNTKTERAFTYFGEVPEGRGGKQKNALRLRLQGILKTNQNQYVKKTLLLVYVRIAP
ncbi:MAG: hypothetical protein ACOVRN_17270 [Flavobacterium sp.]